jgi:glucuronate isomerase
MNCFIHDDFLLSCDAARELYHGYAKNQPIIDYHNHLCPQVIAADLPFADLYEIWLDHDHYKWRVMRANGISEDYCTGTADPYEKYLAFAQTVPWTLRNPVYHWTHLELKRFFGIDLMLGPQTAREIWQECNRQITTRPELTPQGILRKFSVTALCTTDDPADDLSHHRRLGQRTAPATSVYPAFRPDGALAVDRPEEFQHWLQRLERTSQRSIESLDDLLSALQQRHEEFDQLGCRLSDHGCEYVPFAECDFQEATDIFSAARAGKPATPRQIDQYATFLLLFLAELDAEKGWTNQFHTGVWRNNRTRLYQQVGRDAGGDSIADTPQGRSLARFLDELDRRGKLPQTIIYNLNPADNYMIAALIGNFQDGSVPGKMQFGSGWWFLDQLEGMTWQLNTLSQTGLLSRFVGMLTDSRSFMSMTRHEYFRRLLCDLLGREMENGLIPNDYELIGTLIANICYENARQYLRLPNS